MFEDQSIFPLVIISFILITYSSDYYYYFKVFVVCILLLSDWLFGFVGSESSLPADVL